MAGHGATLLMCTMQLLLSLCQTAACFYQASPVIR